MARIFSATYTPYTYEELAVPLREATVAHQAVELNFDTLMTDADKMRAFLNEDWQSYKDYKEYVDRLNYAASDLARNGLTRLNRNDLLQLKRDYSGKIQAINAGILSRLNEIENFRKSQKGQSSRYIGPRPEDYSVDEYMYGNNPFKMGVDGSEIYSYADEQAKASTSRRYQEFTEGGKWRITEVGVDPNTTSMVMDALRTGKNFTDPEYALLAQNNPRLFQYMQAVLDDMREISDNARETFGYGNFGALNDNGDETWIPTPNQARFDSEIYGGINKGILYARKSEADPYQKMYAQAAIDDRLAKDAFRRNLMLKGLENGSLLYNPSTGEIVVNPAYGNTSTGSGLGNGMTSSVNTPDVNTYDHTIRNTAITSQLNSLGLKSDDIQITNNEDGTSSISGFRDDRIRNLGLTMDQNGQQIPIDNKIDLKRWIDAQDLGDLLEANNILGDIGRRTANARQFGNNGNYQDLESYIKKLESKQNRTLRENQMINSYRQAKMIVDTHVDRDKMIPDDLKISDRQYNDIKNAFNWKSNDPFTMDDLENIYMYNSNMRPEYLDLEYSLIGPIYTTNEGKRELTNFGSRVIAGLEGGFGLNEKDIIEYQDLGNDTYSVARKKDFSNGKEYTGDKGILKNITDVRVTKGMLMHKDSEGNSDPLIKIRYHTTTGDKEKIIPMSRLSNNIQDDFRSVIDILNGTYGNINQNNPVSQKAIDALIKTSIQNAFDKYKKK